MRPSFLSGNVTQAPTWKFITVSDSSVSTIFPCCTFRWIPQASSISGTPRTTHCFSLSILKRCSTPYFLISCFTKLFGPVAHKGALGGCRERTVEMTEDTSPSFFLSGAEWGLGTVGRVLQYRCWYRRVSEASRMPHTHVILPVRVIIMYERCLNLINVTSFAQMKLFHFSSNRFWKSYAAECKIGSALIVLSHRRVHFRGLSCYLHTLFQMLLKCFEDRQHFRRRESLLLCTVCFSYFNS